jgi:hypothetical protein
MAELAEQEGWQTDDFAARVHYQGDGEQFSIEYYEASERVLYWRVKGDGRTAVPVDRTSVPDPLRERIRLDLDAAGLDPSVERQPV